MLQPSSVDGVVFGHGHDLDPISAARAPISRNSLRLRSVAGDTAGSKRQVAVNGAPAAAERMGVEEETRRHRGGNCAPAALLLGSLERWEGLRFVPSAAAPPRSQLLDSEVRQIVR